MALHKQCNHCNEKHPLTKKHWYVRVRNKKTGNKQYVCKRYKNKLVQKWRKDNPDKQRKYTQTISSNYIRLRESAKKRGYMINLNLQEYSLIRRNPCHYCGDVIIENTGGAIDRIDNNKGYEIDNCVSCCKLCNRAKHTLTIDQFLSHMQKIVNFNSGEFNNDT